LYFWIEEWKTKDSAPNVYKETTSHRNIEITGEYLKQQYVYSMALHIRVGASWMGARGGKVPPPKYFFYLRIFLASELR